MRQLKEKKEQKQIAKTYQQGKKYFEVLDKINGN